MQFLRSLSFPCVPLRWSFGSIPFHRARASFHSIAFSSYTTLHYTTLHHVLVVVTTLAVHGGTRSGRLVFLGGLGPVTNDKDVQESRRQKGDAGKVIENLDRGVLAQSEAQKGDKDQVQSLAPEAVHESKILAHVVVEIGHRGPPHEFVEEEEGGKEDHVKGQEGFAEAHLEKAAAALAATRTTGSVVVHAIAIAAALVVGRSPAENGQHAEGGHHKGQPHVEKTQHREEASALSARRSLSVFPAGCHDNARIDVRFGHRRSGIVRVVVDPSGGSVVCHSLIFYYIRFDSIRFDSVFVFVLLVELE